jgi:hypothetical protein
VGTSKAGGLKGHTISLHAAVHPGYAPVPDEEVSTRETDSRLSSSSVVCLTTDP